MSFHDVAITVRAENRASPEFNRISADAAKMSADVKASAESVSFGFKEASRDLTTLGTGVAAVARLGEEFGVLDRQQSSWMRTLGTSITAVGGVMRAIQVLSSVTGVATAVQNALNISHATFLALTGVGIGVIIAAAAAMAYFASQMNVATSSVERYNAATASTPSHTRSIRRAGEDELRRRGIE